MNLLSIPILKRLYPSIVRRYLMLIGDFKHIIKISNFIFEIDIRESIERKTYFINEYEKKRVDYLIKESEEINSKILIDVGANIGFYSILLSNSFEQIYSFEPNKRNFQILEKNLKINNLKKIKIFNFGLGEKKQLLRGHSNTKGKLIQTSGFAVSEKIHEGEEVLIQSGDKILQFKNKIITIKIDVEGFELFVLRGIKNILRNNHCLLQIEIWEKNNDDVHGFLELFNYKEINKIDGDTFFSNKI